MMIPLLGKFVSSIREIAFIGTNGHFHKWEHWFPLLLCKCYKQFFRRRYIFWFFYWKDQYFHLWENLFSLVRKTFLQALSFLGNQSLNVLKYLLASRNITVFITEIVSVSTSEKILLLALKLILHDMFWMKFLFGKIHLHLLCRSRLWKNPNYFRITDLPVLS